MFLVVCVVIWFFSVVCFVRSVFSFIPIVIIGCVFSGGAVSISVSRFVGWSSSRRFAVSFVGFVAVFVCPLFCVFGW